MNTSKWFAVMGSPPPMRGKASTEPFSAYGDGITPAYAGKSLYKGCVCYSCQDHPRLCGEKPTALRTVCHSSGSPPPMRGKVYQHISDLNSSQDHPRLCGEKFISSIAFFLPIGSPPPMRGKVFEMKTTAMTTRITPAYAGKSLLVSNAMNASEDHPRLCGEKSGSHSRTRCDLGSPPPMRGKVRKSGVSVKDLRITPAYAGKSAEHEDSEVLC